MKKSLFVVLLMLIIVSFAAAQVGPGRTMYVSVKTLNLKSSAGKVVSTLKYGDEVTVSQVNGKLLEVKSAADSSLTGWADLANFTTKKIITGNTSAMTAKEFALAGKGFNQDVENSYSTQGEVNYDDVDKIESITTDETVLMRFIEDGRLSPGK